MRTGLTLVDLTLNLQRYIIRPHLASDSVFCWHRFDCHCTSHQVRPIMKIFMDDEEARPQIIVFVVTEVSQHVKLNVVNSASRLKYEH